MTTRTTFSTHRAAGPCGTLGDVPHFGMQAELEAMQAARGGDPAGDAADPFEGLNLPDQLKEYLLKPSVTLKDGSTVSPKDFVDGLLADGYGNPEYFIAPKGSQAGFLSKPGSPKVTLNDKQMFYADAAFMAKKRAQKKQEQAEKTEEKTAVTEPSDGGVPQHH